MAVLAAVGRAAARLETDEQIKVNNLKQQIDCHKNPVRRSENCPSGQLSKAFPQLDHYLMAREMISRELFSWAGHAQPLEGDQLRITGRLDPELTPSKRGLSNIKLMSVSN